MNQKTNRNSGTQLLAIILVLGGALGIYLSVMLGIQFSQVGNMLALTLPIVFCVIFAWSLWQGIHLWRGKPAAIRWAKILFAAQVPAVYLYGFGYEYYTLLNVSLQFGQVEKPIAFNLGSAISLLYVGPDQPNLIGFNLIALVCLAYLLIKYRSGKTTEQNKV